MTNYSNMASAGYDPFTGIYHSMFSGSVSAKPSLPSNPSLSLPGFIFSSMNETSEFNSKPAFIDAGSRKTIAYSHLRSLTASAATTLFNLGVRKGDVVLLVSPNFVHFPVLALAVMSVGAIFSTANFLHTRSEIEQQVNDSNPKFIFTTRELQSKVENIRQIILIEQFITSLSTNESKSQQQQEVVIKRSDAAALMYSSGTTGKSKGVICTHKSLIAMSAMLKSAWGNPKEVYLCTVPLSHMFGFSVFVCGATVARSTVVMLGKYAPEKVMDAVEEFKVTTIPAVPPMIVQLARSTAAAMKYYDLGSLREVVCSGAPLAREHMERFAEKFPGVKLSQCYGLTETCGPVTLCLEVKGRFNFTIGKLIPTIEAKIVDVRTGKSLPPKRTGELCVRGPPLMKGYLNNEEATKTAIDTEGWLHTGDLCYIDMHGFVYVVDRIKELIKYKAYQVAPAELEEVLSTHPDVLDVAVIPYPDDEAGEIPLACIVRNGKSAIKEDEIISFIQNKVAPYKKIRKVKFVEFIPRSPSGKILRRALKKSTAQDQTVDIRARL